MMEVKKIPAKDWYALSEHAHQAVFGTIKPASMDRIDYALLCVDNCLPRGYVTVRELDSDTVYWQFGGAFPESKGNIYAFRAYETLIRYTLDHYKRISTLIENTNTPMLKLAMKMGFRIVGVRNYHGILLEHVLERGN